MLPADVTDAGGLRLEEVPVPDPGRGQVRLRVRAISINARDALILAGPFGRIEGQDVVPMSDLAGVVDALGEGVEGWQRGDRVMTAHVPSWVDGSPSVFAQGPGSNDDPGVAAEYVVVDAGVLVRTPSHLTDAEASTLQVAGVTAWNALFGGRPLVNGEHLVVIGSGGVSLYGAQIARALGATVSVVTRHDLDPRWEQIGVTGHVSSAEPGWGHRLAESAGEAHKVLDTIGPRAVAECLDALAPGGEAAVPGLADMTASDVDVLGMIGRQLVLRGVAVGSVQMHRDLADFMTQHELHPLIETTLPFERLADSYAALATPGTFGKVVVQVDPADTADRT